MSASRTSTNAVAAPTSRRMVGMLSRLKARPCVPLAALSPRAPTQLITASDPLSALGKDLGRRRFPEFNDQDASRLSVAQAAAAAISSPAADINLTQDNTSFAASGRAQIVAWVELECLSLEASMEDMLVSMGSADFCSDLGNGMEYP